MELIGPRWDGMCGKGGIASLCGSRDQKQCRTQASMMEQTARGPVLLDCGFLAMAQALSAH